MRFLKSIISVLILLILVSCGTLQKKAALVNFGATKEKVLNIMGPPDDRQFKGKNEAWQYCQTGAGLGYHDYRIFWFYDGKVTGINSYKSTRPGSSCVTDIKPINWDDASDITVEVRER